MPDHEERPSPGTESEPVAAFLEATLETDCWSDYAAADELPPAMWDSEVDVDGDVRWHPIASMVTPTDVDALEAELGAPLPSSHRALLLHEHFDALDIWDIRIPPHLPASWDDRLRKQAANLRAGFLTIASIDLEEWDFRQSAIARIFYAWDAAADGPALNRDHPVFVEDGHGTGAYPVFTSGAAMYRCLAILSRLETRPTSDPDGLEIFLAGDPTADEQTRAWWRALASSDGLDSLPPPRHPAPPLSLPPPRPRY